MKVRKGVFVTLSANVSSAGGLSEAAAATATFARQTSVVNFVIKTDGRTVCSAERGARGALCKYCATTLRASMETIFFVRASQQGTKNAVPTKPIVMNVVIFISLLIYDRPFLFFCVIGFFSFIALLPHSYSCPRIRKISNACVCLSS